MAKKQNKKSDVNGFIIPGFLLIGIGLGIMTGQVAPLTLIGLGMGFLVTFLAGNKK